MSGDNYGSHGYAAYYGVQNSTPLQRPHQRGHPSEYRPTSSTAKHPGYFVPAPPGHPVPGYNRPTSNSSQSMQQTGMNISGPTYSTSSRQMEGFGAVIDSEPMLHQHSPQMPSTVNPSQIFDRRSGYMNRNQSPEGQFAPIERAAPSPIVSPPLQPASQAQHAHSDSGSREQLQAEMRAMIAKMQDYKSKDPTLFSEAWEQLKRDMPAKGVAKRPDVFPQTTPQPATSPVINPSQRNEAHSTSHLPDLGKFPAHRRQRRSDAGVAKTQKGAQVPKPPEHQDHKLKMAHVSINESLRSGSSTPATPPTNDPRSAGTIWPQSKQVLLAQTAISLLASDPLNDEKGITQAEFMAWLQTNPTYDELCRKLDAKGFEFNKGVFARHLLAAISPAPDPAATSPPPAAPMTTTAQSPNVGAKRKRDHSPAINQEQKRPSVPPPASYYPPPSHGSFDTSKINPLSTNEMLTPFGQPLAANAFANLPRTGALPQPHFPPMSGRLVAPPPRAIPQTLTKEARAKKSDFSELMDLTQLSDSDEEAEAGRRGPPSALPNAPPPPANLPTQPKSALNQHLTKLPGGPTLSAGQAVAVEKLKTEPLARPLNESKALRRSAYNPATIARDVLIARGGHPDERPLNFHLDILKISFPKHVSKRTDLSTVRWDLVDPDDERLPKPVPVVVSKDEVPTAAPAPAPPPPPPPTATPGTTTSHSPAKMAPHTPRDPAIFKPKPSSSDRITSQTFVANDKSSPGPTSGSKSVRKTPTPVSTQERQGSGPSQGTQTVRAVTLSRSGVGMVTPSTSGSRRGRPPKVISASSQGRLTGMARDSSADTASGGKRRGRPPGSKNLWPRKPAGRGGKAKAAIVNTRMPEDGIGVVIQSSPSSSAPVEVSYVEQRKPPPVVQKKSAKNVQPAQPEQALQGNDAYATFKCRWIGCKAGLHNLDTLHKHLVKVHRDKCWDDKTKAYSCFWSDCEEFDAFPDASVWEKHITEVHLDPLARELGDGPTTHPAAPDLSYLMDDKGNFVVPIARTEGHPDPLPLYAGRGPTRAYHKAHGNDTPEKRAQAEHESVKWHAISAAKARRGEVSFNRTAEWRTDWEGPSGKESNTLSDSEGEDSEEIDAANAMQE